MKLRARLALMLALIGLPTVAGIAWLEQRAQRNAIVEGTYEAALQQMENGGQDTCEMLAARFERPRRARGRGRRLRAQVRRERFVYDEAYRSSLPSQPPIDPALRAELESGSETAVQWLADPPRARIAMRMPFEGPCAVIVIERATPSIGPRALLSTLLWSSIVALITGGIALIAMGPMVRRLRTLAAEVRNRKNHGWVGDVHARGSDEVAELGRAFNEASAEIRRRVEELSTRDKALTEFVQNTSHDVMVPLTVLQGHLSKLRGSRDADQSAIVQSAIDEAHYLGSLLRNLGAAARLDAGEPHLHRHPIDLGELVERVVLRHQTIAREHGISLEHAVPEAKVVALADSTLTEQAASNLVLNAIRYNRKGGHVAVVLERARSRFSIRVIDDGPGIAPDELARLSERRFRGDQARARRPTGMGLGLHIVRSVAERHEWELAFESPAEGGLIASLAGDVS